MGARTIVWDRCTLLTIVDQFGINIRGFTLSCETLGRLLKKKKYDDENSKIAISRVKRRRTHRLFLWLEKGP